MRCGVKTIVYPKTLQFRFTVSERISLSLSTGCRFAAARAIYLSYFPFASMAEVAAVRSGLLASEPVSAIMNQTAG